MVNSCDYNKPSDEKELLIQIAAGCESSFRKIFDYYRTRIYAYALHLTENESIADEVLQEVFLKVWINRQSLLKVSNFKAWLYVIARNHVYDALKAIARERISRKELSATFSYSSNNVEYILLNKEYENLLQQALNQLSPQQRLIYNLSRQTGARHADIAGKLKISSNTVKTHLVHALRTIRTYFKIHSDQVF